MPILNRSKDIVVFFQDNLDDDKNPVNFQWYSLALDIIESKIFMSAISIARKVTTNICKIFILNEGVELINVPHIFHDPSVKACLPVYIKLYDTTVVYSLKYPIKSQILNFNKFVFNLDAKVLLQDNSIFPSRSAGSNFIGKDYRHIITGDLWIVQNNKLRKLFTKGSKYRQINVSWKKQNLL